MPLARTAAKAATKIPWKDIRTGAILLWEFYDKWRNRPKPPGPSSRDDPAAIRRRLDEFEQDVGTTMQALRADLENFSKRYDGLAGAAQILSARVMVALAIAGISFALALGLLLWLLMK